MWVPDPQGKVGTGARSIVTLVPGEPLPGPGVVGPQPVDGTPTPLPSSVDASEDRRQGRPTRPTRGTRGPRPSPPGVPCRPCSVGPGKDVRRSSSSSNLFTTATRTFRRPTRSCLGTTTCYGWPLTGRTTSTVHSDPCPAPTVDLHPRS